MLLLIHKNDTIFLSLAFQIIAFVRHTIRFDQYLPARRASAFLLTEILGADCRLEDQQDYLLPLYRELKTITEADDDLQMQIHARNGLAKLRDKVKDALTPSDKLEKNIQISNVKTKLDEIRFK